MMSRLFLLERLTKPIILSALMVTVSVHHSLANAAEPQMPETPTLSDTNSNKGSLAAPYVTLESQQFSSSTKSTGEVVFGGFYDVNPTDWAYPSLKQLAERTGCLVGVPAFFQPQRSPTRLELAAGLNACLRTLEGRFPAKGDQIIAQALQTELKSELKTLDDHLNSFDDRTMSLEALRFSTTTKMQGQAVVTFQGGGLGY
jgi:hypothetical protein